MILHIAPDEKFIDRAYNIFQKSDLLDSEFVIVSNEKSLKMVKTKSIKHISYFQLLSKNFIASLKEYDFVVLHWLDEWKMKLILKADDDIKFLWIGWGGDYYNYIYKNSHDLFLTKTKSLISRHHFEEKSFKNYIKKIVKKIFFFNLQTEEIINRIDFFAPVLPIEYQMLKSNFKYFKPKYIDWNYGELNDNLIGIENSVLKNNILIGNSATFENNHIEAIDIVSKLDLKNKKVILPLSYGNKGYGDYIARYAHEILKNKVDPLRDFMNLKDYNKIVSSCSIIIMNHLRQQALSNIIAALYNGAKVFLHPKNPIYSFLKNKQMIIFTIDELNNSHLKTPLSDDDVLHNQKVLKSYLSANIMLNKTNQLIKKLKED